MFDRSELLTIYQALRVGRRHAVDDNNEELYDEFCPAVRIVKPHLNIPAPPVWLAEALERAD